VPFFISGGTQIGDGIGAILSPIKNPVNGFYLLVIPDIFISTAWAYKALKKNLK
jgi:4-diphosphocytidyl-2C-methyl-D-erythritol kinase